MGGGGNVMEALLAMLLSDKLTAELNRPDVPRSALADSVRKELTDTIQRR